MREFQGKDKKALKVKGRAELRQETEKREGAAGWSCFQQQEDESTSNTTPPYIGIINEILNHSLTFPNLNQTSIQQPLTVQWATSYGGHSPLQLVDLLVLVVLLVLHLSQDVQQAVNLSLGFPRILPVPSHFLLQVLNALGQLRVGLGLQGGVLSLGDRVSFSAGTGFIQMKNKITLPNKRQNFTSHVDGEVNEWDTEGGKVPETQR